MKILATGSYLPTGKLSNDDLSQQVDTNDEWIVTRTGIRNRHLVVNENTSDLATKAARAALRNAGINAAQIQLIIVATSTPDGLIPGVSHQVLKNLEIEQAMAFDVNAACTGFVYAPDVAASLMQTHEYEYALVIGSEVMSKVIDWNNRNTCVLFGDGAGAVVLGNADNNHFLYTKCMAIPDVEDVLVSGEFIVNHPLFTSDPNDFYLKMKGQDVFKFAVRVVCESMTQAAAETGIPIEAVDYYVLHQANTRIMEYVARKLQVPVKKFYSSIADTGNTSAASIPIVLDKMWCTGNLKPGMKLMLTGFGAGLTYATILLRW